jgi:hypothetical protein
VIAEDLVAREPWERSNIERFRRALVLLGESDVDAVIADPSGQSPFMSTDFLWPGEPPAEPDAAAPPVPATPYVPDTPLRAGHASGRTRRPRRSRGWNLSRRWWWCASPLRQSQPPSLI